ncbi:MAG: type I-U CRISPR-associated protein Csb2 [Rhodospirillales bacterium]|nr:type I-U CRISPR-associated protein Csb2 [Rhodospirillales bacterium]
MERALLISVRFHEGRYHGAGGWPPAPARLFQALMAGAARGAEIPVAARDALDWLERLPPPVIAAPRGEPGQGYTVFVPNNDLDAALSGSQAHEIEDAVASIRVGKTVRHTLFDASAPLLYCWHFGGDETPAAALCEAAGQLYQLGRGIDPAWADAAVLEADKAKQRLSGHGGIVYHPSAGAGSAARLLCPQPGTRRSLADRFAGMRARFRYGDSTRSPLRLFTRPPRPLLANIAYNAPPDRLVFALRGSDAPDGFAPRRLSEAATLIAEVREAAARRLCAGTPARAADVARYLVGQGATDADKAARVTIVPIPSIGHPHADLMIRRLAVYVPQPCPVRTDDLAWAFAQVTWPAAGPIANELQPADDDAMALRYETAGRHWRSVTPLALAGARRRAGPARAGPEAGGAAEQAQAEAPAVRAVRQAVRHAGVRVAPVSVAVQREPFDERGERAGCFAASSRFSRESLWHVALTFAAPVSGPLVLGDGRYLGLGLMRTVDRMPGVLAFAIEGGLATNDPAPVARAARRAMLARVQAALPPGQSLPTYVTGHEDDGSPARSGTHRHLAVVPDLARRRLLYIAPSWLERIGVDWREVRRDHARVEGALKGMAVLRAGRAGRLALALSTVEAENDPLFAPSREWQSVSNYRVTRHRRGVGDAEALTADTAMELDRIGWPAPAGIEVLSVRRGARGGLSGRLRLTFATAQAGPLVIGRTAHMGGGLFAPPAGGATDCATLAA